MREVFRADSHAPQTPGPRSRERRARVAAAGSWPWLVRRRVRVAATGSRPWLIFGEGPTKVTSSALDTDRQDFTADDIRYTTNHGALYAITLGWPAGGDLRLHSLYRGNPYMLEDVCSVRLLGLDRDLQWTIEDDGMHIKLPSAEPDEPAYTFRIVTRAASSQSCR